MRKVKIPSLLLPLVAFGAGAGLAERGFAQEAGEPIVIGERFEIQSQILDETRPVLVATPPSYEAGDERYPVLYVLDGDFHLGHA